jgi:hypothetical protein
MAKGPDELERDLELKRRELHARVDGLRQRTNNDVRASHESQRALDSRSQIESGCTSHSLSRVRLVSGVARLAALTAWRSPQTTTRGHQMRDVAPQMVLHGLVML